jgi:2-succinyl-5-enolpyruvyl-6-hydroxy-3-cyclohexene-1-carboxylate synthase
MSCRLHYTDAANTQVLIALLKAHGIHRIVANPGTGNIPFVGSVQNDSYFTVYSGIDERHSAYLACGMAYQSGEPVVLSCTGATASRNYLPALTEAFYRKIPVLAVTSLAPFENVGNLFPQMIDRSVLPKDTVKMSVSCPAFRKDDARAFRICQLTLNKAILELFRHGGGPVHVNLENNHEGTFNTLQLPAVRKIERYDSDSELLPTISAGSKVAVWIGSHKPFSQKEHNALEVFAKSRNAVVFCDLTSSYSGECKVSPTLILAQQGVKKNPKYKELLPDLVIHIGEVSGDYNTMVGLFGVAPVWRVSEDGDVKDVTGNLVKVFEMSETRFFNAYTEASTSDISLSKAWNAADAELREAVPELPFSNHWIARRAAMLVPDGSILHLGIVNTLRNWNYFLRNSNVRSTSNVGGFGIDGGISSLIGASLVNENVLCFGIFGDLSFFYDLNALGNRHLRSNIRIIMVNNGCGGEFNLYINGGSQFGEHANDYIAAGHHFGDKSRTVVKAYVEALGFAYMSAVSKEEFDAQAETFFNGEFDKPVVLECFTNASDESAALKVINSVDSYVSLKGSIASHLPKSVTTTILKFRNK